MIRVLQKADIERVVDIWLDTNLKAHYFIPGQYWKDNIDLVKKCCHRQRSMCMRMTA